MDVDFMVYTDDWRFIDYPGPRTRCLVPFLGCSPSYSTFQRCFDTSLSCERSQILSELKFKLHSFPAWTFAISSFSSNGLGFGGWTRNTGKFRLDTENRNYWYFNSTLVNWMYPLDKHQRDQLVHWEGSLTSSTRRRRGGSCLMVIL